MHTILLFCAAVFGGLNLCLAIPDPNPDVRTLTSATSRFSHTLYKELTSDLPVAVYSPFSAHTALSMAYLGARTITADQMKSVLQLSSLPEPYEAYRSLLGSLNYVEGVVVNSANGIWVNPNIKIRDEYKNDVVNYYNATAENILFTAFGGPQAPINEWVADRTDNMITNLLGDNVITQNTAAVLVNTLYFNGTWRSPFNPVSTYRGQFQNKERIVKEVDFMKQTGRFGVKLAAVENVDVVRLPFMNERFAFYIVLPRTVEDFPSLEKTMSGDSFDGSVFFADVQPRYISITLPKFNITATLNMNNPLNNLGMTAAFTKDADFSGISDAGLEINEVVQKVVMEVLETGTVAAAATYVSIGIKSSLEPEDPFKIVVDRPFIFYIRDDETGLILFHGKQTDPTRTEANN